MDRPAVFYLHAKKRITKLSAVWLVELWADLAVQNFKKHGETGSTKVISSLKYNARYVR